MSSTSKSGKVSHLSNPAPGTTVAVPAGGQTELDFDFSNEAPFVAAFLIEVDGLPDASWAAGTGAAGQVLAPAYGGGTVTLRLAPPVGAAPGDYALKVRVMSEGVAVEPGERTLLLRVEPGGEAAEREASPPAPAAAEPSVPVAGAVFTAPEPERAMPLGAPAEPPASAPTSAPPPAAAVSEPPPAAVEAVVARPPSAAEPAQTEPAPDVATSASAPDVAAPEPAKAPPKPAKRPSEPPAKAAEPPVPAPADPPAQPAPAAAAAPSPDRGPAPAPTPAAQEPPPQPPRQTARAVTLRPSPPPQPPAPAVARQEPAPAPVAAPPPEEVLPVVEMPEQEAPEEKGPDAPSVEDPADGTVIPLKPGESIYIRFSIHNEALRERTYIVEEDRSLPIDWIKLVQDRVNITHNATGQVFARVSPPSDAEPGSYPFQLRYGQQGGILTPCNLVLQVLPTPAVAVAAKNATAKAGPFGRSVGFDLSVTSAGNADTAFRIAVKAPLAQADGAQAPAGPEDLYETDQWRYLFDREIDNLESSGDRAPMPRAVRLEVRRKGLWWFGFREQHRFRVAAVPVTDPANGGKPGNTVELTASRWRPVPLPGIVAVPLLFFLLVLLGSGAHDVEVTNAKAAGDRWYVIQPKPANAQEGVGVGTMAARLKWSAPFYALLNLDTNDKPPVTYRFVHSGFDRKMPVGDRGSDRTLEVRPALFGRGELINVTYVPIWTVQRLRVSLGPPTAARLLPLAQVDENIGTDPVKVQAAEATIRLKRGQYVPVNFENTTPFGGGGGRYIHVWVVNRPAADQVECLDLKESYDLGPGRLEVPVKLKLLGDTLSENQELVFMTTDARCQILRLKLEVAR